MRTLGSTDMKSSVNDSKKSLHDSIATFLDEDDLQEELTRFDAVDSGARGAFHNSTMFTPEAFDSDHVRMIMEDWKTIQRGQDDSNAVGAKLLEQMLVLEPTSVVSMNLAVDGQTHHPRLVELQRLLVRTLEQLILEVLNLEPSEREMELEEIGMEWLDEGVDPKLLHKSLLVCLSALLEPDAYSASKEAWETTFRDTTHKMECMF